MKKGFKIIRIVAFTLVMLLIISVTYNILSWKDTSGDYKSSVKMLEATENDLIDVVFVGSSHCYCGIYPSVLWDEYGISSFDMAISGQDKISAYYQLKNLCKTQSPKVVVVDVFATTYDRGEVIGNDYRNYLSLNTSVDSLKMVNEYLPKEERADFIFRFPIIHSRYRELTEYDFVNNNVNNYLRGEEYHGFIQGVNINDEIMNSKELAELSEENKEWVDRLIELSQEENFDIQFVLIPYAIESQEQASTINAVGQYIEEQGYCFTNYNREYQEINFEPDKDFIDEFHLNCLGAEKFTRYLANNLLNRYELTDHRGDDNYYQWDKDSDIIKHYKAKETLPFVYDNVATMEGVKELSDCKTIIYVDNNRFDEGVNYFEMLIPFGMDYDDFCQGGTWIYSEGELQKVCENVVGTSEYITTLGRNDILRLGYYGIGEKTNILINKDWTPEEVKGLNVVVYDELLEEVIFSKAY